MLEERRVERKRVLCKGREFRWLSGEGVEGERGTASVHSG